MEAILAQFHQSFKDGNGYSLASTITPQSPQENPQWLYEVVRSSSSDSIANDVRYATVYNNPLDMSNSESQAWHAVYVAYWQFAYQLLIAEEYTKQGAASATTWSKVYDAWKDVSNAILRGYTSNEFDAWTIPCVYVAVKFLRIFAIRADEYNAAAKDGTAFASDDLADEFASSENAKLEDAARQMSRIFGVCLSDRSPIEDSRKWAVYYITNMILRVYFRLNNINLAKNPLKSIQAAIDMPSLDLFPKSHRTTFKYYLGVIDFMEERYALAEDHLNTALRLCPKKYAKHRSLILTYLVPCHLLTNRTLPSLGLLNEFPLLKRQYLPLAKCIKRGDLSGFDAALAKGRDEFVKRRTYLTLERGRDVCLRNLFRKVFLAAGFEEGKDGAPPARRTRVRVNEFWAGLLVSMGSQSEAAAELDRDEVECLIANCIYKGLMKGYISRERAMVVLSKGGAFPGTGV